MPPPVGCYLQAHALAHTLTQVAFAAATASAATASAASAVSAVPAVPAESAGVPAVGVGPIAEKLDRRAAAQRAARIPRNR
jgi:hypothetical protein